MCNVKVNPERLELLKKNKFICLCSIGQKCPCTEWVNNKKCKCGVYEK